MDAGREVGGEGQVQILGSRLTKQLSWYQGDPPRTPGQPGRARAGGGSLTPAQERRRAGLPGWEPEKETSHLPRGPRKRRELWSHCSASVTALALSPLVSSSLTLNVSSHGRGVLQAWEKLRFHSRRVPPCPEDPGGPCSQDQEALWVARSLARPLPGGGTVTPQGAPPWAGRRLGGPWSGLSS